MRQLLIIKSAGIVGNRTDGEEKKRSLAVPVVHDPF